MLPLTLIYSHSFLAHFHLFSLVLKQSKQFSSAHSYPLLLMFSLLLLNLSPWPMHSITHPFTNIPFLSHNPTHDLPFQPIFIVPVFYVPVRFSYLCAYLPSCFTCPCSYLIHFYALYCLCLYTFHAFVCVSYLHCIF